MINRLTTILPALIMAASSLLQAAAPAALDACNVIFTTPSADSVSGTVKNGRLLRLDVTPASRRADVIVEAPFSLP